MPKKYLIAFIAVILLVCSALLKSVRSAGAATLNIKVLIFSGRSCRPHVVLGLDPVVISIDLPRVDCLVTAWTLIEKKNSTQNCISTKNRIEICGTNKLRI